MTRRTDFQKANTYTGQKLKGPVDISYKIDGVRVLYRENQLVTRNNKKPPGLLIALHQNALLKAEHYGDVEIYSGKFADVNGQLHRHAPDPDCITEDMIYPLAIGGDINKYDPRLYVDTIVDPTPEDIEPLLQLALAQGFEGLVLRAGKRWYRVKPYYTADVRVTGHFEQLDTSKVPKGQLGGFDTAYGKVTAFTEEDRVALWDNPEQYHGALIEVVYRELYDSGKFRYCVKFSRFRWDKDEETFDTKQPYEK